MRFFSGKSGLQKGETLVADVYQNPQRTQTNKRPKGMPTEHDATLPAELMTLLGIVEGDEILVRSDRNPKGVVVKALNAPEELRLGENKADVLHCFITLSESVREELGLEKEGERKTKKFKLKYEKVYVRRK